MNVLTLWVLLLGVSGADTNLSYRSSSSSSSGSASVAPGESEPPHANQTESFPLLPVAFGVLAVAILGGVAISAWKINQISEQKKKKTQQKGRKHKRHGRRRGSLCDSDLEQNANVEEQKDPNSLTLSPLADIRPSSSALLSNSPTPRSDTPVGHNQSNTFSIVDIGLVPNSTLNRSESSFDSDGETIHELDEIVASADALPQRRQDSVMKQLLHREDASFERDIHPALYKGSVDHGSGIPPGPNPEIYGGGGSALLEPQCGDGGGTALSDSLPSNTGPHFSLCSSEGAGTTPVVPSSHPHPGGFPVMSNTTKKTEVVTRVNEIKAGRYKKLRCIGRGANASVFSCLLGNGVTIAMKEIQIKVKDADGKLSEEEATAILHRNFDRAANEMRLLAEINDPHVVQVYHCSLDVKSHKALFFMELISGGSLGAMIRAMPHTLAEGLARTYVKQVVLALKGIHSKGIVHRDLKCDNVLLTGDGVVKLSDFGDAKLTTRQGRTASLALVGTPFFIAPEVLLDKEGRGYDAKADIWSLGITVSELLSKGKVPWPKFTKIEAAFMHIAKKGTVPQFPTFVSAEGQSFLRSCCARDPTDRPTATELLEHPWLNNASAPVGEGDSDDDGTYLYADEGELEGKNH